MTALKSKGRVEETLTYRCTSWKEEKRAACTLPCDFSDQVPECVLCGCVINRARALTEKCYAGGQKHGLGYRLVDLLQQEVSSSP